MIKFNNETTTQKKQRNEGNEKRQQLSSINNEHEFILRCDLDILCRICYASPDVVTFFVIRLFKKKRGPKGTKQLICSKSLRAYNSASLQMKLATTN